MSPLERFFRGEAVPGNPCAAPFGGHRMSHPCRWSSFCLATKLPRLGSVAFMAEVMSRGGGPLKSFRNPAKSGDSRESLRILE